MVRRDPETGRFVANQPRYKHERVKSVQALRRRGKTKIRSKKTPSGKVLRFAFPPGRRRKGSGELQAILRPKKNTRRSPAAARKALTRGNPKLPTKFAPGGATLIYSRILAIEATKEGIPHDCDAACRRAQHRYRHDFSSKNASVWGLEDGRLLIG